jgi:glutathione S-transferase
MYTLYYAPSTAALAVHWMLIELGAPFELELVDLAAKAQKSDAYLAMNPSGHVPAMIVDGRPQAEAAALLMLLAERHPEAGLAPAPGGNERADYLQWMFYFANTMQPAFRAWFYPEEPAGPENVDAARRHARGKLEPAFARLDRHFGDGRAYVLGQRLSAADFMFTMLCRWSRDMPRPATDWPHLRPYIDRMRAMPSLREVHAREGLTDWIEG